MTAETDHGIGEAVAARIERRWATLSIVIVGLLVGMATFIGIHQATMPQGHVETADPKTLHLAGEFIESNLGSAVEANGSITVRAIRQQYSFTQHCVVVPSDTPITFWATVPDRGHQHQYHAGAGLCLGAADPLQGAGRPRDAVSGVLRDRASGHVGQGQGGGQDRVPQHGGGKAEADLC